LLHKFISKKGRPFSAFLVRGGDGKVTFEFAPREAKAGAKSSNKPASKKTPAKARKTA
jgi:DNA topoisomerase-3